MSETTYDADEPDADRNTRLADDTQWNTARRWGFRFLFIYFLLYIVQDQMGLPLSLVGYVANPIVSNELPGHEAAGDLAANMASAATWVHGAWEDTVNFIVNSILRCEMEVLDKSGGSGDTTFDWLSVLTILILGIGGATIWSIVDRKPRRHWRLVAFLTIAVRYQLAGTMLVYGFLKLYPLQFPHPFPYRMEQSFGDLSPMGLLWSFMGASPTYTSLTGAAELLGGGLLLFRRTTTLGAMVTLGAMANVAALNFCYDVPVKLLSTHMCLLATFLLALESRRLLAFFVLNRPFVTPPLRTPFTGKWWSVVGYPTKVLLAAAFIYSGVANGIEGLSDYGPDRPRHELSGLYAVDTFTYDGEVRPALLTDDYRWDHMTIDDRAGLSAIVWTMTGAGMRFSLEANAKARTLTLSMRGEEDPWVLTYERPSPTKMIVKGDLMGHSIDVALTLKTPADYRLTNRGFHWVSEQPFNR